MSTTTCSMSCKAALRGGSWASARRKFGGRMDDAAASAASRAAELNRRLRVIFRAPRGAPEFSMIKFVFILLLLSGLARSFARPRKHTADIHSMLAYRNHNYEPHQKSQRQNF